MIIRCSCLKGALTRFTSHSGLRQPLLSLRSATINRRFITVQSLRSIQKQIFLPTVRGNVCLRLARFRGNVSNNAEQIEKVTKVKLDRKNVIRLIGLAKSEKLVLIGMSRFEKKLF